MRSIIISWLLLSCSIVVAEEQRVAAISVTGECSYNGTSFTAYYDSRTSQDFGVPEPNPTYHDYAKIREEIAEWLFQQEKSAQDGKESPDSVQTEDAVKHEGGGIYSSGGATAVTFSEKEAAYTADGRETLRLLAIYQFDGDSDFVLLCYLGCHTPVFYVGYVISSGKWYMLSDIGTNTVEEGFNEMVRQTGALSSLSPLCRVGLLLSLKYRSYPVVLLDSPEETLRAPTLYSVVGPPRAVLTRDELYFVHLSKDTLLWKYSDPSVSRDPRWIEKALQYVDTLDCEPPRIDVRSDTTIVATSVYAIILGEVANWEVRFLQDGQLASMEYVDRPVFDIFRFLNAANCDSPFFRMRKTDTED